MSSHTATITLTFCPPAPPDGLPNYKPNGSHIYRVRNSAGRIVASGSCGPDRNAAERWARKVASDAGLTVTQVA